MDIYDLKVSNGNYIYTSEYHSSDTSKAPSEEFVHTIKGAPTVILEGLKLEE